MTHVVLRERGRVHRWTEDGSPPEGGLDDVWLDARRFEQLAAADEARTSKDRLFEWRRGDAVARSWVGVQQLPGLTLELLPKIDGEDGGAALARDNLMAMLDEAGEVPLRARDHADLAVSRGPLHERLITRFARRLCEELTRGPDRGYVSRVEDLGVMRGKLVMSAHLRRNAARRDRFTCAFEELSEDTLLNRVLRAACRVLLPVVRAEPAREALGRALALLDPLTELPEPQVWVDRVVLDRRNERFADLLAFSKLVLRQLRPTGRAGRTPIFSLLFDMDKVFEGFVTAFVQRRVRPLVEGVEVHPQAKGRPTWLARGSGGQVLKLHPDLLVERQGRSLILDTKWKRAASKSEERGAGMTREDLYQLSAYTRRFNARRSVLIYPWMAGATPRGFDLLGPDGRPDGGQILTRFVRLDRRLNRQADRELLAVELAGILNEGLEAGP